MPENKKKTTDKPAASQTTNQPASQSQSTHANTHTRTCIHQIFQFAKQMELSPVTLPVNIVLRMSVWRARVLIHTARHINNPKVIQYIYHQHTHRITCFIFYPFTWTHLYPHPHSSTPKRYTEQRKKHEMKIALAKINWAHNWLGSAHTLTRYIYRQGLKLLYRALLNTLFFHQRLAMCFVYSRNNKMYKMERRTWVSLGTRRPNQIVCVCELLMLIRAQAMFFYMIFFSARLGSYHCC